VGDQSVQEAVRATGVVALGLCALDLAVEVTGSLLIHVVLVVVFAEISYVVSVLVDYEERSVRWARSSRLTVLVVHGKLALQLVSDVGHDRSCVVLAVSVTGVVLLLWTGCDVFLL